MADLGIHVIHGLVVSREELIDFILVDKKLFDFSDGMDPMEFKSFLESEKSNDIWYVFGNEEDFVRTWPCCSPLKNKKYLLGPVLYRTDTEELLNEVSEINLDDYWRSIDETLHRLKAWRPTLDREDLKTVLMLNDCPYCR